MEKKKQKPVTEAYLERAALHYLGRFMSSKANLVQVLSRKVQRRTDSFDIDSEHRDWIVSVADKCERLGYINDATYAATRAEALLRRGKPGRMIQQDLRHKGIDPDLIDQAITALPGAEEDSISADEIAAAAYLKRRGFGAYRRTDRTYGPEKHEKEIASMARAGFSYDVCKRILNLTRDELEILLSHAR
ncbi:hypothetical protein GCM10017044_20080 [Kordiimonas sediminis]|uniref:Regulatory protein RecX n=1 Tax=Kordiimonas sediminis TaxID=1735581 RepID=A0A919AVK5_9PROT|nr:regulatory protein RecX [Kordiimonas sediminis]GHF25286.1 hypothetical protein GCM10017044_20080 [Kordiimonas sediminis]